MRYKKKRMEKVSFKILFLLVAFMLGAFHFNNSHAGLANTDVSYVVQPNGKTVPVMIRGDEWNNFVETEQGYTIEKAGRRLLALCFIIRGSQTCSRPHTRR